MTLLRRMQAEVARIEPRQVLGPSPATMSVEPVPSVVGLAEREACSKAATQRRFPRSRIRRERAVRLRSGQPLTIVTGTLSQGTRLDSSPSPTRVSADLDED